MIWIILCFIIGALLGAALAVLAINCAVRRVAGRFLGW